MFESDTLALPEKADTRSAPARTTACRPKRAFAEGRLRRPLITQNGRAAAHKRASVGRPPAATCLGSKLRPAHRGRQGVRRAAGVLCQRKRASLGVAADRPHLARMHHRSAVGAHALERSDQIINRKIRQRERIAGPPPADVHTNRGRTRVRLPALALSVAARLQLEAQHTRPEPPSALGVVRWKLDQRSTSERHEHPQPYPAAPPPGRLRTRPIGAACHARPPLRRSSSRPTVISAAARTAATTAKGGAGRFSRRWRASVLSRMERSSDGFAAPFPQREERELVLGALSTATRNRN
jgi:hypothetical protein